MPVVRIEHTVPNFEKWKQAFDSDPADRKGSGVRGYHVYRLREDPNHVMIDLAFDTMDEAESFVHQMERIWSGPGKSVMREPRARIAEIVESKTL